MSKLPPKNTQILSVKTPENGKVNQLIPLDVNLLGREIMTVDEAKTLCTNPLIPLREKVFYRIIYEGMARPFEALNARVENWERWKKTLLLQRTKITYDRWHNKPLYRPKLVLLTQSTNELLRELIGNRKKGYIFTNQKGEQITKRYMAQQLHRYATLLGTQKIMMWQEYKGGRVVPVYLVTLQGLRKAGERHHDASVASTTPGDPTLSAQAAGHTMETKNKHYANTVDWETIHESIKKHHPAFTWE